LLCKFLKPQGTFFLGKTTKLIPLYLLASIVALLSRDAKILIDLLLDNYNPNMLWYLIGSLRLFNYFCALHIKLGMHQWFDPIVPGS
jgi:hypothetical protein